MNRYKSQFMEANITYKSVMSSIEKVKKSLILKAKSKGIYENFGQKEVRMLKDKFNYTSLVYGSPDERKIANLIDNFDEWCMDYNG